MILYGYYSVRNTIKSRTAMYFFLYKRRIFTDFLWNFYKLKEVWVFTDKTGKYYTVYVFTIKNKKRMWQDIGGTGIRRI